MMRGLVARGLKGAVAAALMRAGVAVACPSQPPLCPEQQPDPSELYACTEDVSVVDEGLVVTIWTSVPGPEGGQSRVEAQRVGDEFVVTVPGPSGNVNWCDSLARFTVDDVTVGLSELPGDGVAPEFTDVRVVQVTNANTSSESLPSRTGMRYGSGAFCLWAAEAGTNWDRRYEVTVQAWDDAHHVLYQGVAKIRIECGAVGSGDTSLPADRVFYEDPCTSSASAQCFVEIPVPAGVCEPAPPDGGGDCIPSEGHGCDGDGGSGGGDTGGGDTGDGGSGGGGTGGDDSGDGGSECIPVEGHGCGLPEAAAASSGDSSSGSGSTEGGGGTSNSEGTSAAAPSAGTTPRVGCSAFPYADPSIGALVLLGLGLLRRRRSN